MLKRTFKADDIAELLNAREPLSYPTVKAAKDYLKVLHRTQNVCEFAIMTCDRERRFHEVCNGPVVHVGRIARKVIVCTGDTSGYDALVKYVMADGRYMVAGQRRTAEGVEMTPLREGTLQ